MFQSSLQGDMPDIEVGVLARCMSMLWPKLRRSCHKKGWYLAKMPYANRTAKVGLTLLNCFFVIIITTINIYIYIIVFFLNTCFFMSSNVFYHILSRIPGTVFDTAVGHHIIPYFPSALGFYTEESRDFSSVFLKWFFYLNLFLGSPTVLNFLRWSYICNRWLARWFLLESS